MDAAVRLEDITKSFGDVRALDGFTMTVATGQVYGLLGPNGAGKTTAIRLILDLIRPTSGTVTVLGHPPRSARSDLHRRIGYVPGELHVDGRQTARQLLTYLATLRGGVHRAQADQLAERFALRLDAPIRTLSRGNRQKVALIQAFMHEPDLLVLDEPTSGLDPLMQTQFAALVREAADEGRTVFMSSHVMSEIQGNADRVGIVREGRLILDQGIAELRDQAAREITIEIADDAPMPVLESIPGVTDLHLDGNMIRLRLLGSADPLIKALASTNTASITAQEPELGALFLAAESGTLATGGHRAD